MQNEKVNDIESKLKDLSKKYVRRFRFKQIPYILLIFFSLLLVGISEVLKPDFSFEVFKQARFWWNLLITNLANFLMALSALFITSDKIVAADKDDIIATNTKALNEIAPEIQDKMVDQFIKHTNREIKIDVYRVRNHNKLLRLEKKHSTFKNVKAYNDFLIAQTDEEKDEILKNKYVKKRLFLEKQMDNDYLQANIDAIKVRNCPKLNRSFLTVGSNSQYQSDFPTPNGIVIMRGLLPKFLLWISITLIFFMFGLDIARIGWMSLFTLTFRILGLVWNYIYGSRYANTYVNETVIDVLYMRIRWLVRFKEWKQEQIKLQKEKEKEQQEQPLTDGEKVLT